ncbi:redox-regulated molecular chaperone Hsp33 [Pigmentiphaga sp. NML080357]|uniref:Hsp33 family molecular chaperone HslO n=1 Tax=Pigmentiphaga sp. NML080357 TaxID=2008675 RepID=UPI000B42219C|nr:Hsp33 family molecular chaperone HslO [Pigmentiphaga sp. NML080357]OVZ62453.1 redox-regulated molecular chaperone Hsp33 [Pigmentiphaga sp. NML080357]
MSDQLKKYLFEDQTVRAEVTSIRNTWKEIQARHDYPPAVQRLLGELVAASALLAANIKFNGTVVMQLQGDGPIGLIVVECHADLGMRATVKLREGHDVPDDGTFQSLLNSQGGGRFSVLLDPQDRQPGQQPYQGIVALQGDSVAQALEHYMLASEQLQTRIWLAANAECAAGVLLQQLPKHGGKTQSQDPAAVTEDTWERAQILADTLKSDELLTLTPDALIRRLYWQETLRTFDPATVTYRCTCSREKVADVLLRIGKEEVDDILAEQGRVQINCDYCVKSFEFDAVDCAELFANDSAMVRHHSGSRH